MTLGVKHLYLRQLSSKNKYQNKINIDKNKVSNDNKIISFDLEYLDNNRKNDIKIKNKIYINKIEYRDNKLYLLE